MPFAGPRRVAGNHLRSFVHPGLSRTARAQRAPPALSLPLPAAGIAHRRRHRAVSSVQVGRLARSKARRPRCRVFECFPPADEAASAQTSPHRPDTAREEAGRRPPAEVLGSRSVSFCHHFGKRKIFFFRSDTFSLAKHRLGICGESSRKTLPRLRQSETTAAASRASLDCNRTRPVRRTTLFQELSLPVFPLGGNTP